MSVTASGFSKTTSKANVNIGQASIADVKMAVGASATTVEVTSSAPLVSGRQRRPVDQLQPDLIANSPNGGNDITYIAQTAPGVTMNTGGGYGNFSAYGLPATSNLFTVNGENDMDPYLNLNNSGATNLTLGRNDVAGSDRHQQRLLRPVRTAGGCAGQLRDQVGHQPVSRQCRCTTGTAAR